MHLLLNIVSSKSCICGFFDSNLKNPTSLEVLLTEITVVPEMLACHIIPATFVTVKRSNIYRSQNIWHRPRLLIKY